MKTFNLDGIEITHIHHSAVKIKTRSLVIYVDPYKVADEQADLILITHDHQDHLDPDSILKLRKPTTKIIVPEALKEKITGDVKTLKSGETYKTSEIKITAIPAYNLSISNHLKEKGYLGFVIDILGKRIYQSGDTNKIPEMTALKDIDIALIHIAGPGITSEEMASAVKEFKPKIVVPIHYGEVLSNFGLPAGSPEKFAGLVGNTSKVMILD